MERFLNIDNLLFYIKQIDDFQKVTFIFWRLKTFRREKSARNNHVSSTREFWNLRSKTKSWNFFEVRWRPYSPKESFLEDFIFNLKPFQTERFFCCNLFLIGSASFLKKRLDKHPTSPLLQFTWYGIQQFLDFRLVASSCHGHVWFTTTTSIDDWS